MKKQTFRRHRYHFVYLVSVSVGLLAAIRKVAAIGLPTRSSFTLLRQLCNLIPAYLVPQLARDTGVAEKSRSFTPWNHVVMALSRKVGYQFATDDFSYWI
jgi:hypothetical protein